MEKSVYIIKPDGMSQRGSIRRLFSSNGLQVVDSITIIVPESALRRLYADLASANNGLWRATLEHMHEGCSEFGVVEGQNAVHDLFTLCGEFTNPQQCNHGTIRRIFGLGEPIEVSPGQCYWRNVIHRSKDRREAESDLQIYRDLSTPESH